MLRIALSAAIAVALLTSAGMILPQANSALAQSCDEASGAAAEGEQGPRGKKGKRGKRGKPGIQGPAGPAAGMVSNAVNATGDFQQASACTVSHPSGGRYVISCPATIFGGKEVVPFLTPISAVPTVASSISTFVADGFSIVDITFNQDVTFAVLLVEVGDHPGN